MNSTTVGIVFILIGVFSYWYTENHRKSDKDSWKYVGSIGWIILGLMILLGVIPEK